MNDPDRNEVDCRELEDESDPVDVLLTEFVNRHRQGESPTIEEYVRRHPDLADEIRELFPMVVDMERLKEEKSVSSDNGYVGLGTDKLDQLGDFRILGEIGRGGMGVVYEAQQLSLGRRVAVKVLPEQSLGSEKRLRRFQREAQTAAKLHHTNIVPVFGVGQQDQHHYIVMQLIQGVGLDEILVQLRKITEQKVTYDLHGSSSSASRSVRVHQNALRLIRDEFEAPSPTVWDSSSFATDPPSHGPGSSDFQTDVTMELVTGSVHSADYDQYPQSDESGEENARSRSTEIPPLNETFWRSVAKIGVQVAEALEYAHQQGTLHRDIKPANLLLEEDGTVWVADFGLAKVASDTDVSRTGDIVGTLCYMAPERFREETDARGDIFSLGLTLYELLTLHRAFDDSDHGRLVQRITQTELKPPRHFIPEIPCDLETIVLKAAGREPSTRYQTAGELADDLRRFLEDRPIEARRITPAERLWRWCRRNRIVAGLAGAAFLLVCLVAVVATVGYKRESTQRRIVETERERATAMADSAVAALDRIYGQIVPSFVSVSHADFDQDDDDSLLASDQPTLSNETASILENFLGFYDELASRFDDNPDVVLQSIVAYRRVGEIHERLGKSEEAASAFYAAIERVEGLVGENTTEHIELRTELARIYSGLGNVQLGTDFQQAREHYQKAVKFLPPVEEIIKYAPETQYELARGHYYLSRRPPFTPKRPPRRPSRHEGTRSGRPGRGPDGTDRRPEHSRDRSRDREDDFEKHNRIATGLLIQLVVSNDGNPDYKLLLALCHREAHAHGLEARQRDERAIAVLEELHKDYPDVPQYAFELSETYSRIHFSMRDEEVGYEEYAAYPEAEERLRMAQRIANSLSVKQPNIPQYSQLQPIIYWKLATIQRRLSKPGESNQNLRNAVRLQTELLERFSQLPFHQRIRLGLLESELAQLSLFRGKLEESVNQVARAIANLEMAMPDEEKSKRFIRRLIERAYRLKAETLEALGDMNAAEEAVQHARQIRDENHRERRPHGRGQ